MAASVSVSPQTPPQILPKRDRNLRILHLTCGYAASKKTNSLDRVGVETSYSIVIPAFNEEGRIGATLERTLAYFAERPECRVEVLVVDDGSTDGTANLIESWQERSRYIRLLSHDENMGKGWAVRTGMLAADGEYVLFMDADGSTDIAEIEKLSQALDGGADIAIGSRDLAGSEIRKHQPVVRETMGKAFSFIARVLAIPEIADTTCGFKLFRKPVDCADLQPSEGSRLGLRCRTAVFGIKDGVSGGRNPRALDGFSRLSREFARRCAPNTTRPDLDSPYPSFCSPSHGVLPYGLESAVRDRGQAAKLY